MGAVVYRIPTAQPRLLEMETRMLNAAYNPAGVVLWQYSVRVARRGDRVDALSFDMYILRGRIDLYSLALAYFIQPIGYSPKKPFLHFVPQRSLA